MNMLSRRSLFAPALAAGLLPTSRLLTTDNPSTANIGW